MDFDISRLKHRPIFLLPYEQHDGLYQDSDCKYLSLGWAQYDHQSLSLKTLRHTKSKWSRQSEEIPLQRAIDLVILLAHAMKLDGNGKAATIMRETLENQPTDINLGSTRDALAHSKLIRDLLHDPSLVRRLRKLKESLTHLDM